MQDQFVILYGLTCLNGGFGSLFELNLTFIDRRSSELEQVFDLSLLNKYWQIKVSNQFLKKSIFLKKNFFYLFQI